MTGIGGSVRGHQDTATTPRKGDPRNVIARIHNLSAQFKIQFIFLSVFPSMPASETTPLLANGHDGHHSFSQRIVAFVKAEGEPSWLASLKWFIFGSWLNLLLVFIPLSTLAHFLNWDAALRFSFSFIAIVPLAKVLSFFMSYRLDRAPHARLSFRSCLAKPQNRCHLSWARRLPGYSTRPSGTL